MQNTLTTDRWTRRSFLGIPIFGWALFVVAGAAIAAVYYLTLGVTGTVSFGVGLDEGSLYYESEPSVVAGSHCSASLVDGDLAITGLDGLYPNDFCEIHVVIGNSGSVAAQFQNFESTNAPDGAAMFGAMWGDDGFGNPDVSFCGATIPANDGTSDGTFEIGFRMDVPAQADPSQNYDFVAGDGPMFVPDGAANCG